MTEGFFNKDKPGEGGAKAGAKPAAKAKVSACACCSCEVALLECHVKWLESVRAPFEAQVV